jgi:hypothetical protein
MNKTARSVGPPQSDFLLKLKKGAGDRSTPSPPNEEPRANHSYEVQCRLRGKAGKKA